MSLDITGHYRYPPPRASWLALHQEDILDPDLPIIDAHHHIWEEPGNLYLLDDFASDMASGHAIQATVFVQAHYSYRKTGPDALRPVGETEKIMALCAVAAASGRSTHVCAAIIGYADLMLGNDVAAVLVAHIAAAGSRFKGVRHSVSRDSNFPDGIVLRAAPAEMLAHPTFREGLATVARYGLSYDAMLYHQQIPELTAMARALPALPIILDHYGCMIGVGPYVGREAETFREWRANMKELASCPNVLVKLGGMGMIICGARWHERPTPPSSTELAAAWSPLVETCIELFGVNRCMFESNFPVDKGMYSYATLWNAFKRITAGASDNEKAALFRGTAARSYRIG
jgi:L-fuconolactonase